MAGGYEPRPIMIPRDYREVLAHRLGEALAVATKLNGPNSQDSLDGDAEKIADKLIPELEGALRIARGLQSDVRIEDLVPNYLNSSPLYPRN